jgi:hypothetical protein
MSEPRYNLSDFNTIPAHDPTSNGTNPERDSWHPIYLSGITDDATIPPSLGHNLIYPGLRHVFSGPQESAKTLAAYVIGLNVIRTTHTQILLLDFEMGPRGAKRRWRDCGATDTELDNNILYLAPDTPATLERIWLLVALNPTLVIIDAAAGAFDNEELDDNKRSDAEKWRKLYVDPFFDNGIATIVLDHVVKDKESRSKYTIGSERKTGGGEVHIGFDTIKPVKRGSTGIYKMTLHKDREGHHNRGHFYDLHIASNPETHQLDCEFRPVEKQEGDAGWLPTIYMERVSAYLHQDGEARSRTHLEENVEGGTDYIRQAVEALKRLGYVTETKGARNSRLFTHQRLFITSEWEKERDPATPPDPASTPPEAESRSTPPPRLPPYGGAGVDGRRTAAEKQSTPPDDPEVLAMLAHYDLLETPEPPPADLHDQEPT